MTLSIPRQEYSKYHSNKTLAFDIFKCTAVVQTFQVQSIMSLSIGNTRGFETAAAGGSAHNVLPTRRTFEPDLTCILRSIYACIAIKETSAAGERIISMRIDRDEISAFVVLQT